MEHPLKETFTQVKGVVEYVNAEIGVPIGIPDNEVWIKPTDLFGEPATELKELRQLFEKILKTTSKNMIGSALIQAYQWQIIMMAVGGFLVSRRVPDLALENISVKFFEENEEGDVGVEKVAFHTGRFFVLPDDPAAAHPDAEVVQDISALRFRLRLGLVDHFNWIIGRIGHHIGTKPRGLWLDVADNIVGSLIWLMLELDSSVSPADIQAQINALIQVPGSPLKFKKLGIFTLTYKDKTQAHHKRASCCYWYRYDLPDASYCSSCPRRPMEERIELYLSYMAEEYATLDSVDLK